MCKTATESDNCDIFFHVSDMIRHKGMGKRQGSESVSFSLDIIT